MHLNRFKKQIAALSVMVLFTTVLFAQPDDELGLTNAEKSWLKEHAVIRLASDISWPPFEWINSEMEYQGIAADYVKLIEKKLGIRFEIDAEDIRFATEIYEIVVALESHFFMPNSGDYVGLDNLTLSNGASKLLSSRCCGLGDPDPRETGSLAQTR